LSITEQKAIGFIPAWSLAFLQHAQEQVGLRLISFLTVMNIKWDYNYYQPWSDNK